MAAALVLGLGTMGVTDPASAEVVQVTLSAKVMTVQVTEDDEREASWNNGMIQ